MELTGTIGGGAPGGGANDVNGIGTPVGTPAGMPAAAAAASSRSRERERLRDLERSRRREARGSDGILVGRKNEVNGKTRNRIPI